MNKEKYVKLSDVKEELQTGGGFIALFCLEQKAKTLEELGVKPCLDVDDRIVTKTFDNMREKIFSSGVFMESALNNRVLYDLVLREAREAEQTIRENIKPQRMKRGEIVLGETEERRGKEIERKRVVFDVEVMEKILKELKATVETIEGLKNFCEKNAD